MKEFFFLTVTIILAGIASFGLTYLLTVFPRKGKMLDIPNERSLHEKPVPKSGGLAIVSVWYVGLTILYFSNFIDRALYFALLSGVLIAIISLIDDLFEISPLIRLLVHFITAILAFSLLGGLRPLVIPEIHFSYVWIVYPLAIIGMVWFINLFNFMDGVDGFASIEAIFVASVLFVMSWNAAPLLLIVSAGGFLAWNWPRAKIFMGDTGSTQLGFILVVLGIYFHNKLDFSILNWMMLTSPFWFDATLTLLRRIKNGENISKGHRKHVYQRIIRMGNSHQRVNLMLLCINMVIIVLVIVYRANKALQVPLFILTLLFYYTITRVVDRKVPFNEK